MIDFDRSICLQINVASKFMSTTNDLLSNEIYPALFHVLPEALPEFEFIRKADRYRSNNTRKISGEDGQSKGKVEVLERAPFWIKDYRVGGCSIWDYIQERDGLANNGEVLKRLAELAQVKLPEQQLSPEESARIEQANFDAKLWEVVNGFFIDCLSNKDNKYANTDRAKQVQDYLTKPIIEGGRGYNPSVFLLPGQDKIVDREFPLMEVGYIPGTKQVREYILSKHFTESQIFSVMSGLESSPDGRIGIQNILTFPYRDHAGRIRGMVFRSLYGNGYKYLYSQGLQRNKILFNLRAVAKDADLSIVESPLDALHAAALGIKNITALGGSGDTLNTAQIDLAIRYGAKRITLMLDNDSEDGIDRAGAIGTDKAVALLQKHYPNLRVFVGEYPEGVKDLDELLSSEGVVGYQRVKDNAAELWRYQLNRLFAKYNRLGEFTSKQIVSLQEEAIQLAASLSAIDKDQCIKAFINTEGIQSIGVTEQSLADAVNALRAKKLNEEQNKAISDLLIQTKRKLDKGDGSGAVDLLQLKIREIKTQSTTDKFEALTKPIVESELRERLRQRSSDLKTGYMIGTEEVLLPAGAISIIAAPTSHGKTTFLVNLALRVVKEIPNKSVYILSYEEDADSVTISAMNTYISTELSSNNRRTIRSYYRGESDYFTHGKRVRFEEVKSKFFDTLITTGRLSIQYVDYDSDTLGDAIRYLYTHGNAGAVFIDYMQLLHKGQQGKNKYGSRQEELKQICIDLKDVAVETGLPLILGAQFNRQVVSPARLLVTNIGEAGDIERIANLIIGFWNNNKKMMVDKDDLNYLTRYESAPNALYVEILKYRGGKPDAAGMLSFDGNTGVIENQAFQSPISSEL